MTNHFDKAEQCLARAGHEEGLSTDDRLNLLHVGQIHATLATIQTQARAIAAIDRQTEVQAAQIAVAERVAAANENLVTLMRSGDDAPQPDDEPLPRRVWVIASSQDAGIRACMNRGIPPIGGAKIRTTR